MKRNHYFFSLASALCIGTAVLAMIACSSEDNTVNTELPAETRTYTVSIPASMDDAAKTRTFKTTDKVYVYKKSVPPAWLSYNGGTYEFLGPDQDGKTCNLTGTITGTIAEGDVLQLVYNMNGLDSDLQDCNFDYTKQDGTEAGVLDGAMATIKVKSIDGDGNISFCQESEDPADDGTDSTAHFQSVQSMFCFQFKDASTGDLITVKQVGVSTNSDAISSQYFVSYNEQNSDTVSVTLATPTAEPIYMSLCIQEDKSDGAVISFSVVDADDNLYQGSKTAPTGDDKYVNGKYYYDTEPIAVVACIPTNLSSVTLGGFNDDGGNGWDGSIAGGGMGGWTNNGGDAWD